MNHTGCANTMAHPTLAAAIAAVPAGAWAVGVSGGTDSVALLTLLRQRAGLRLHVAHLDHQTRGGASAGDAAFVAELACDWNLPATIALRSEVERAMTHLPTNPSARYRAVRMRLFQDVVRDHSLDGVILAHHADDQAETVLHRLLRGAAPSGLTGMRPVARIGSLTVLRPLLSVRREMLREFLRQCGQPWREDESNASTAYFRNRLRGLLQGERELRDDLIAIAGASRELREFASRSAPTLSARFDVHLLASLPRLLAVESARRWLVAQGVPLGEMTGKVTDRLIEMASDAATSPRVHFPGQLLVQRCARYIEAARG